SLQGYTFIRRWYASGWSDWRNTSEVTRIPDLKQETVFRELPTGYHHNWGSGWLIDGENRNGFIITEVGFGFEHQACIQYFYESGSYNIYYRKPNNNTTWSKWFKFDGI